MIDASDERLKDHPFAGLFPLLSHSELSELADDIATNGLRDPVMLHRGMILDGRNRYRACLLKNLALRYEIYSGTNDDALDYVISKNVHRRHLKPFQRALAMSSYEEYRHGGPRRRLVFQEADLPLDGAESVNPPPIRAELAERAGISERLMTTAAVVRDHGSSELLEAAREGALGGPAAEQIARRPIDEQKAILATLPRDETGKLTKTAKKSLAPIMKEIRDEKQAEKKDRREAREADLGQKQRALPDKKYGVILADPEWAFEVYSRETGMDRAADNHYPTSETDAICARPVQDIAAADCVLFLWATVPMLPDALRVMAAWDFDYKSHCIWLKDRTGTGYWFRNQHELLLVGTRGNIPAPAMGTQFSSVNQQAVGAHSEKPASFYLMIETYFPTLPKIELNARDAREGWDRWGFEAPSAEEAA